MRFVQYKHKSISKDGTVEYFDAMGDRQVVILDARNSIATSHADAQAFNKHAGRGYSAYQLMRGERFSTASPVSGIIDLPKNET
jgi:hypothetical protein